jgi:hypothetical protein
MFPETGAIFDQLVIRRLQPRIVLKISLVTACLPPRTALASVDAGAHSVPVEGSRGLTNTIRP